MARVPSVKMVPETEAPKEQQPWVAKMLVPVNQFIRDVGNALNKNLTFGENMVAQFNSVTFYLSDSQNPYPFSFQWENPGIPPKGCLVTQIDSTDNVESVLSGGNPPRWGYSSGRILIYSLRFNLTQNKTYKVTFLTFA